MPSTNICLFNNDVVDYDVLYYLQYDYGCYIYCMVYLHMKFDLYFGEFCKLVSFVVSIFVFLMKQKKIS